MTYAAIHMYRQPKHIVVVYLVSKKILYFKQGINFISTEAVHKHVESVWIQIKSNWLHPNFIYTHQFLNVMPGYIQSCKLIEHVYIHFLWRWMRHNVVTIALTQFLLPLLNCTGRLASDIIILTFGLPVWQLTQFNLVNSALLCRKFSLCYETSY